MKEEIEELKADNATLREAVVKFQTDWHAWVSADADRYDQGLFDLVLELDAALKGERR